jgi:hypothetical protein
MDRYWKSYTAASPPAVPPTNAGGFPADGVPSAGVLGTVPGAWWYHAVTEELRNAIAKLGTAPDWTKTDQLGAAITAALSDSISAAAQELAGATGASAIGFIQDDARAVPRSELDKSREHATPEDFGALGDGKADDSNAFSLAESSAFPVIELTRGRVYVVNGLTLKKAYIGSGQILLNGATLRIDPIRAYPARARTAFWFEDFPALGGQPGKSPARMGHSAQRPMYSVADLAVWVDPTNGNDSNDGLTRATALKTFAAAMGKVPYFLFHAATIYLLDGTYGEPFVGSHIFTTAGRWSNFQVIGHTPNNPAYTDTQPGNVVFHALSSDGGRLVAAWSCIYGGPFNTNFEGFTLDAFWPYDISCQMQNCIIQNGGGAYGNYAIGGHGGRVHFASVLFRNLPADGLIAEATDKAWFDFDSCTLDTTALCPIVSAKNGSIVSFKRCGFDLSTSYCEPGSLVMGDTAANLNQYGIGLPGKTDGYVVLAGGTAGADNYNEGAQVVAYGRNAEGANGGTLMCYFGSRELSNTSAKFQVSYSDATGSREVFRVKAAGFALPSVGYQMNAIAASQTSGFTNTLFVDQSDGRLKFRDASGTVQTFSFA